MAADPLQLVVPGTPGACWRCRYHSIEPWVGCGHGCQYCSARFSALVAGRLQELGTGFENPVPLLPAAELPGRIVDEVRRKGIRAAVLCRYTDILAPAFLQNGLAWEILSALARSPVERIVLTTKGLPDDRILALLREHKSKISYGASARPAEDSAMEPHLPPLADRLSAAALLRRSGVRTTIHLEPLVAGLDDEPVTLRPFLDDLRRRGLFRVVFSYLALSGEVLGRFREKLPPRIFDRILPAYDNSQSTASFPMRPEIKRASVGRIAGALRELGFEFAWCPGQGVSSQERAQYRDVNPCGGSFCA